MSEEIAFKGTHIKVFVTKKKIFRAIITPKDKSIPPFEVTVGGNEWRKGKGQPYQSDIIHSCERILGYMADELVKLKSLPVNDMCHRCMDKGWYFAEEKGISPLTTTVAYKKQIYCSCEKGQKLQV